MAQKKRNAYKDTQYSEDKALASLFGGRTSKEGLDADWSEVPSDTIRNIVWAADYLGGNATFGSTKNGHAYVIRLFVGTPYSPRYFDGDTEGRAALQEFADALMAHAANAS